jgi:SAM-dependent methyltransferase
LTAQLCNRRKISESTTDNVMAVDPKQFWEAKLLAWEQGRYGSPDRPRGLLEWIANRSSMSLRFRVAITPELLRPYLANKRVVELGCGSGIMAGKLIEYGAASYLGIDIAESAVETARARYGDNPKVRFLASSVAEMPPLSADLVISLGLFDWLTDDEIIDLFRKSGSADFLHAIAERQRGIQQWLHRSYVQLAYGYRTNSYRPRYFKCDHVRRLATVAINRPIYVFRSWRLSFGALVSSVPIGEKV